MSELTPMMRQYRALKDQHPRAILLFRLGDFFEAFFEDAHLVARELQLTLTSRPVAKGRRIPMCGIPHHALRTYLRGSSTGDTASRSAIRSRIPARRARSCAG